MRTEKTDRWFDMELHHAEGLTPGLDLLLLLWYTQVRPGETGAEFCAGDGTGALVKARLSGAERIYAVEVQTELYSLLEQNAENCGNGRVIPVLYDARRFSERAGEKLSFIFMNPPYLKDGSGKAGSDPIRNAARREVCGTVAELMQGAAACLKSGGRLTVVYRSERLPACLDAMRAAQLVPKRLRPVYTAPGADAKLFLCEGVLHGGEGMKLEPPLVLCDADGRESAAAGAVYRMEPEQERL